MRLDEIASLDQKLKFHDFINYVIKSFDNGKLAAAKLAILHDNDTLNVADFTSVLQSSMIPIKIRNLSMIGNDVIVTFDEVKRD